MAFWAVDVVDFPSEGLVGGRLGTNAEADELSVKNTTRENLKEVIVSYEYLGLVSQYRLTSFNDDRSTMTVNKEKWR